MGTMVVKPVFIDTNILVYANTIESPFHAQARRAIKVRERTKVPLWINRQILREYLTVLTRPRSFPNPPPLETLIQQVQAFEQRFRISEDNREVTSRLLGLLAQIPTGGHQVHDANIVATMLAYGVDQILTHNVADFKRFSGIITVLPLGAE